MPDLFRLKIVSKRQITVPQRLMDLLGLKQGDEIQLKVANGKIVQVAPVRITPEMEMESDAEERFKELEDEPTADLGDSLKQYQSPMVGWASGLKGLAPMSVLASLFENQLKVGANPESGFNELLGVSLPFARSFSGVQRIAPVNFRRGDERLEEVVAESLANAFLDLSRVAVEVKDGEVTLSGRMNKIEEKLTAELITRNVLGVRDVHNEIEIAPTHSTAGLVGTDKISQARTRENIEEQQKS